MVIPRTSPTTYPAPPVLLVIFAVTIWPELLVSILAVIPLPLPVILNKGTWVNIWLVGNPSPAFVTVRTPTGPPIFSIYPWIAVEDVESLTFTPFNNKLSVSDVVVIPTFNFLGKVLIEFGSNLLIFWESISKGEL